MSIQTMNIAFATDENYVGPLAVSLNSLLRHTSGIFRIYIIDGGISDQSWKLLSEIVLGPNRTLTRLFIPEGRLNGAKISHWFTMSTYSRIVLPELVPDLNRILYLDCDLLIRSTLQPLYEADLGPHIVGAIEDPNFQEFDRLCINRTDRYFNAGVLLIDLSAWNKAEMTNTVIRHIREYPERATWLDQCHLNACLTRRWQPLHPRWNVQMEMLKGAAMRIPQNSPDIIAARKDPAIIHFTSDQKPWVQGTIHPYRREFRRELAMTPFRHWMPSIRKSAWWARLLPKAFVRRGQFLFTYLSDIFSRVSPLNQPIS